MCVYVSSIDVYRKKKKRATSTVACRHPYSLSPRPWFPTQSASAFRRQWDHCDRGFYASSTHPNSPVAPTRPWQAMSQCHIPTRNTFIALPNGLLLLALRCPASRKIYTHALHTTTPPASTHSHQHILMEAPFAHESLLCLTLCTPHACETRITRYVRPPSEQSTKTLRALVMNPGRPWMPKG